MGFFLFRRCCSKTFSLVPFKHPQIISLFSSPSLSQTIPHFSNKILLSSLPFPTPKTLATVIPSFTRFFASQPSLQSHKTSGGLSVDEIVARSWPILEETESNWKSRASAIAQSIQVIKKRLQWRNMVLRAEHLSAEMNRSDLWENADYAGKISREYGLCMGRIKEVNVFEQELIENVEMLKLAREEDDTDLESECMKALLRMRRNAKEKELEALLAGEQDSCPCFIEVHAGAGGTKSMDWAAMVIHTKCGLKGVDFVSL